MGRDPQLALCHVDDRWGVSRQDIAFRCRAVCPDHEVADAAGPGFDQDAIEVSQLFVLRGADVQAAQGARRVLDVVSVKVAKRRLISLWRFHKPSGLGDSNPLAKPRATSFRLY